MRILKILSTVIFVMSLAVPTFAQSSSASGASGGAGAGGAGAAGSTAAASGAAAGAAAAVGTTVAVAAAAVAAVVVALQSSTLRLHHLKITLSNIKKRELISSLFFVLYYRYHPLGYVLFLCFLINFIPALIFGSLILITEYLTSAREISNLS